MRSSRRSPVRRLFRRAWLDRIAILVLVLVATTRLAQGPAQADEIRVRRTGRVIDEAGRPVAGVEVDVASARVRTLTDAAGRFELAVPPGVLHVALRRMGYEPAGFDIDFAPGAAGGVELAIKSRPLRVPSVVVQGERATPRDAPAQPGRYALDSDHVQKQIANFEDILRGVHSLPGVSTASDVHGDFSVRGSAAHSNSIWVDGIEIFFPYHLLGFNSIFSPGLVESAEFWSGGAPAEYGDATGGVLAVHTRGLLPPREHVALGLSYLSAQARAGFGDARW